jgi:selenium-binding protein 1
MNLMVTSDFICPATTLHAVPGDLGLRGSVRVWNFKERRILRTVTLPTASGSIDVKLIAHDPRGRAYTAGMTDDQLYLIDTRRGTARAVFDFGSVAKGGWPQLMRMTEDGDRLFITLNMAGKVVMLDTSDPEKPRLVKALDLGQASGPHYLALTADERRLVVSDYFLNEDEAGKVHAEGDHKVHVLRVSRYDLAVDERFQLHFNTAFATGPARPHGMAFK